MYTLKQIAEIVGGKLFGTSEIQISNLSVDSRTIYANNNSLFFALKGRNSDGCQYISALYKKEAFNYVVEKLPTDLAQYANANFIVVSNTLQALQSLCAYHRQQFKIPVTAITGSNGKTVVKEWLYELMQYDKKVVRSPKSYNSQIGVPLSVWLLRPDHEFAIFEAGISQPDEMQNLSQLLAPDYGIFTNIGDAHQENFVHITQKIKEKLRLFDSCKLLVYCKDYEDIHQQITQRLNTTAKLLAWSLKVDADFTIRMERESEHITKLIGLFRGMTYTLQIPFIDHASIENCIHIWVFLLYLGYDNYILNERFRLLSRINMRLELKAGMNDCTIIDDCYNSDLVSVKIALDLLGQQSKTRRTVILSDILQTTGDKAKLYGQLANMLQLSNIDRLIGIGSDITIYASLFQPNAQFYESTEAFIENFDANNFRDEAILLKGARSFQFEAITSLLQKKTHRTILEIKLNAIIHNLNYYRSLLKPNVKIAAMVKAFSYGHGGYEIANLLQNHKIDYLSVAYIDEGVELRKAGINLPIMVMNPESQSFPTIIKYQLEPVIYSFDHLQLLHQSAKHEHNNKFSFHIEVETGMHRLGFTEDELPELLNLLQRLNNLELKSIFSHLAASEDSNLDNFTQLQTRRFESMSQTITAKLPYRVMRHLLNSAGIERFPEAQFDMVRLGIGLYGYSQCNADKLVNVSTLKTNISQIKEVSQHETVGYGLKGKLGRNSLIATVPIGYADGFDRRLGNRRGKMLVKNTLCEVVGNVCMDMCMLDVTDIQAVQGDEVIVFGDSYPIFKIAQLLDTIPYEVMTSMSGRIKNVYVME